MEKYHKSTNPIANKKNIKCNLIKFYVDKFQRLKSLIKTSEAARQAETA